MIRWKNLREDPPAENTKICIKIGNYYDVFDFERYSEMGWGLLRDNRIYDILQIPHHALYIDLNKIEKEYGL